MKMLFICLLAVLSISTYAEEKYSCNVVGEFTNLDNQTVIVDSSNITVLVDDDKSVLFGRQEEPLHRWDTRAEVMPWAISIRNESDGGKNFLVLTLRAPNQNGPVGTAYSESGSKVIGFGQGYSLEAICIRK